MSLHSENVVSFPKLNPALGVKCSVRKFMKKSLLNDRRCWSGISMSVPMSLSVMGSGEEISSSKFCFVHESNWLAVDFSSEETWACQATLFFCGGSDTDSVGVLPLPYGATCFDLDRAHMSGEHGSIKKPPGASTSGNTLVPLVYCNFTSALESGRMRRL